MKAAYTFIAVAMVLQVLTSVTDAAPIFGKLFGRRRRNQDYSLPQLEPGPIQTDDLRRIFGRVNPNTEPQEQDFYHENARPNFSDQVQRDDLEYARWLQEQDDQQTLGLAPPQPSADLPSFIPADNSRGYDNADSIPGYILRTGNMGPGYYLDPRQVQQAQRSPAQTRSELNGNMSEDQALEVALRESMAAAGDSAPQETEPAPVVGDEDLEEALRQSQLELEEEQRQALAQIEQQRQQAEETPAAAAPVEIDLINFGDESEATAPPPAAIDTQSTSSNTKSVEDVLDELAANYNPSDVAALGADASSQIGSEAQNVGAIVPYGVPYHYGGYQDPAAAYSPPNPFGYQPQVTGQQPSYHMPGFQPQMTGPYVPQVTGGQMPSYQPQMTGGYVPQVTGQVPGYQPQMTGGYVPQVTGQSAGYSGYVPQNTGQIPQTPGYSYQGMPHENALPMQPIWTPPKN